MAAIDDANQAVQQRMQDTNLVRSLLDSMAAQIRTPAGNIDETTGAESNQRSTIDPQAPPPAPKPGAPVLGTAAPDHLALATSGATGDLAAYMRAASGEESGGNPNATNARTGASGTFQIMPGNWPSWAKEAGVDPGDHSAAAQNKVAGHKMQEYYDQFGSWGAVAVAWYAGPAAAAQWVKNPSAPMFNRPQGNGNEPSINAYVANILGQMKAAPQ